MTRKQIAVFLLVVSILCSGAVILFIFNPNEHSFYPECVTYTITGILCPGCGSTRALYQLVHGNIGEAIRLNPAIMLVLCMGVTDACRYSIATHRDHTFKTLFSRSKLITGLIVLAIGYAILRNLPWDPFTFLHPAWPDLSP